MCLSGLFTIRCTPIVTRKKSKEKTRERGIPSHKRIEMLFHFDDGEEWRRGRVKRQLPSSSKDSLDTLYEVKFDPPYDEDEMIYLTICFTVFNFLMTFFLSILILIVIFLNNF